MCPRVQRPCVHCVRVSGVSAVSGVSNSTDADSLVVIISITLGAPYDTSGSIVFRKISPSASLSVLGRATSRRKDVRIAGFGVSKRR